MRPSLLLCAFKRSFTLPIDCANKSNYAQAYARTLGRALYPSNQTTRKASSASIIFSQRFPGTITAFCFASFGFGYYHFGSKDALALEVDDSFRKQMFPEEGTDIKTITPWVPYTMEDVDEYLRTREAGLELRPSSGVLRVDFTQINSNMPMEDTVSHLSIGRPGGMAWLATGIFDGHW